jgi:hypothetical protein
MKSPQKKVSSSRTVLISNRSTITSNKNPDHNETIELSNDNQSDLHEEPKVKRIKIDPISPSSNPTDILDNEINQKDLGLKSIVTVPTIIDEHDYRRDLNEKRRVSTTHNSIVSTTDNSKTKSSRSRSRSKSKDHHQQRQRSSTNSHSSSTKTSKIVSELNEKPQNYSRSSSSSSKDKQHRHQHERKRSSDLSNHHHKQYSNQLSDRHEIFNETSFRNPFPSIYHQRNINDITLPANLHQQRQPVRHKRFNYNHQSVADHPRFANSNVLQSPTPLMDFNYPQSPSHHQSVSSMPIGDRK